MGIPGQGVLVMNAGPANIVEVLAALGWHNPLMKIAYTPDGGVID